MRPPKQSTINLVAALTLVVAIPLLSWSGYIMHEAVLSVGSMDADKAFLVQVATLSLFFIVWAAILHAYCVYIAAPVRKYGKALGAPDGGLPRLQPSGSIELRELAEAYNARASETASTYEALRQSEERLRLHLRLMPLGAMEIDTGFRITRWNQAAERNFGYPASEAVGANVLELIVPDRLKMTIRALLESLSDGISSEPGCNSNVRSDGSEIVCEWYNTSIYGSGGTLFGWASIVRDVTKERQEAERILYLSSHDSLTGLRNRRYAQERLESESLRSARSGSPYSVAIFDVDHFKRFNDVYGHECGDVVLRGISDVMVDSVRETDVVSRWGGEEFLVLFPGTGKAGATEAAEKIRARIEGENYMYGGEALKVTITAGVSTSMEGHNVESCVRQADMSLLSGKAKGRNVVIASELA